MTRRTANILIGALSLGLFITLVMKLKTVPGGLILPGYFLGGIVLVLILVGCLVVTFVSRLIFKKSFWTIYFLTTILCFGIFHYKLYSPTLTIVVPPNYSGKVDLILSSATQNILELDSNGIGYLNEWTFEKTYTKPIVIDKNGKNLDSLLVGFNPSAFWSFGKSCCVDNKEIYSMGFTIEDKEVEHRFKSRSLTQLVDLKLTKMMESDENTIIDSGSK